MKLLGPNRRPCGALSILYDRSIREPRSHAVVKYREKAGKLSSTFVLYSSLVEQTETHVLVGLLSSLLLLLLLSGRGSTAVGTTGGTASDGSTTAGADVGEQVLDVLAVKSL